LARPTTAVFTHTIGGRPSAICVHVFPPSADPYSRPERVPR
jgi:hypothetical protein